MPTGSAPPVTGTIDMMTVRYLDAEAGEALVAGDAVAMIDVAGTKTILKCGADLYADRFMGFVSSAAAIGEQVSIVTGRGSRVAPIIEGAGTLTPNARVFLSATAGEVTSTPPTRASGRFLIPVGSAVSTTELALLTDHKTGFTGI